MGIFNFTKKAALLGTAAAGLLLLGSANAAVISSFADGAYADVGGSVGAEADTIAAALAAQGNTVNQFSGSSAMDWEMALADVQLLVIPELRRGNLGGDINASGGGDALRSFVAAGGGLIVSGSDDSIDFLNTIFGYSMQDRSGRTAILQNAAAAGTAFEGGPASLPNQNATVSIRTNTLPAGGLSVYRGTGNRTTVALIPYSAGEITYLGWDWYNSAPIGSTDGAGWNTVLASAVTQVARPKGDVPEPPTLALLGLGLIGFVTMRKRFAAKA